MTANQTADVDLLGGKVRAVSFETDCAASEDVLESMYWDVTFLGVLGVEAIRAEGVEMIVVGPDGYQFTQFREYYKRERKKLDVVLRQEHRAGEKLFTDHRRRHP